MSEQPEVPVRTIVTCFLIYVDWKPITILTDKKKSKMLIKMAEEKGKKAFAKEMTIPDTRMREIGTNIFTRLTDLDPTIVKNIINIRNKYIVECFELSNKKGIEPDIAWNTVKKSKGKPFDELTYDEFNRWTLDISQYVLLKR